MSPDEALQLISLCITSDPILYSPVTLGDNNISRSIIEHQWSGLCGELTLVQNSMITLRGATDLGATKVEGSVGLYVGC